MYDVCTESEPFCVHFSKVNKLPYNITTLVHSLLDIFVKKRRGSRSMPTIFAISFVLSRAFHSIYYTKIVQVNYVLSYVAPLMQFEHLFLKNYYLGFWSYTIYWAENKNIFYYSQKKS